MVSNGQLTGMILAILMPMLVIVALFVYMRRAVRMKGMVIVFFFGVTGFVWQAFIKSYVILFAVTPLGAMPYFTSGFGQVLAQMISGLLDGLFVTLALIWALYFCNLRDMELRRAPMIGLGFGCAYTIMNYVIRYAPYLVRAIKMRAGTFQGTEQEIQEVQSLTVENMYLFILSCVMYTMVMIGVTLWMGYFHRQHYRGRMFIVGLVPSFLMPFLNALMPTLMPDLVSAIIYNVLLAIAACYAMWMVTGFYRDGKLMLTKKTSADALLPKKEKAEQKKREKANFAYAGNKASNKKKK